MPSLQFSMLICNFWKVWWRVRREEEEGGRLMGGQTTRLSSAPGPDESGLPCWGAGRELCSHRRTRPAIQDLGIVLVLSSTKFFSIYFCVFLVNNFNVLLKNRIATDLCQAEAEDLEVGGREEDFLADLVDRDPCTTTTTMTMRTMMTTTMTMITITRTTSSHHQPGLRPPQMPWSL